MRVNERVMWLAHKDTQELGVHVTSKFKLIFSFIEG